MRTTLRSGYFGRPRLHDPARVAAALLNWLPATPGKVSLHDARIVKEFVDEDDVRRKTPEERLGSVGKMRRLNARQLSAIRRLQRGVTDCILPVIAKQLEARGLLRIEGSYHRVEWNRRVPNSTLARVVLTDAGRAI